MFKAEYSIARRYQGATGGGENAAFYTNLGTAFNSVVEEVKVQSDNKVLVGGQFTQLNGVSRNRLVRLNSDGTEDSAFYTNLGTGFNFNIDDLDILTDDSIIAVGSFTSLNGNTRNGIVKLSSAGVDDTTFASNIGTGFNNNVFATDSLSDDSMVVGGDYSSFNGNTRNYLVKLASNGTEVSSFYTNLGIGLNGRVDAVKVQSDNKILVGGQFTSLNGNTRNYLVRLNADGTEDVAFYTNLGTGFNAAVTRIDVQSDGKIIIVGNFTTLNGNTRNRAIRLNSDGTEDSTFITNIGTGFTFGVTALDIQADEKILIGGSFNTFNGNSRNRLVRLNSDGTEDVTFHTNLGTGAGNLIETVASDSDGKIYVAGFFTSWDGNTRNRIVQLDADAADTELMTQGTLSGIYRPSTSSWDLDGLHSAGDESDVELSITAAGQVQYTSSNLAGTEEESLLKYSIKLL
jgi:uncharacterized delta-60 repeat protein